MMRSERRGLSAFARGALGGLAVGVLALTVSACASIWGGAALVGLIALGTLTSPCYDYLDVTVLDADGRKTCAATVTASNGGSQFDLASCYYTPLSDGHWTLRASLPGFPDAVGTVEVDHAHDCTRYVQSVELSLNRAGSAPTRPTFRTAPAVALPAPVTPPAPAQALSSTPPSSTPPAPPATSASASPSAQPASSATPPVGVFPDTSATPR